MNLIVVAETEHRVKFVDKRDNVIREVDRRVYDFFIRSHQTANTAGLPQFQAPFKQLIRQVYVNEIDTETFLEEFLKEYMTHGED